MKILVYIAAPRVSGVAGSKGGKVGVGTEKLKKSKSARGYGKEYNNDSHF